MAARKRATPAKAARAPVTVRVKDTDPERISSMDRASARGMSGSISARMLRSGLMSAEGGPAVRTARRIWLSGRWS